MYPPMAPATAPITGRILNFNFFFSVADCMSVCCCSVIVCLIACCLLLVTCYLLLVTGCCPLPTAHCLPPTAYCQPSTVNSFQPDNCNALPASFNMCIAEMFNILNRLQVFAKDVSQYAIACPMKNGDLFYTQEDSIINI